MTDGNKKTYVDRASIAVGLAGAFVTVAVAATKDRPASAVAIAFGTLLVVAVGLTYVWTSRSPTGERRFPRRVRIGATAAVALLAVSAVLVAAVPSLRRTTAHDVFGVADISRDVSIAQIVLEQSPDWYRLHVTAANETNAEQLIRSAALVIYLTDVISSCGGTGPHYRINDRIRVTPQGTEFAARVDGTVQATPGPTEFTTAVTGELRATCSDAVMTLTIPTQMALPAHEHTTFVLDLPKQFKAPGPYPYPSDYIEPANGATDESTGVSMWAASVLRVIICVADPPVPVMGQHLVPTRPGFPGWPELIAALSPPTYC